MQLDFAKFYGLLPAIVQDHEDGRVLMLGFMNQEAFEKTVSTGKVTFFSRTRNKLWTKGETSGHYLLLKRLEVDCDLDTVLVHAEAVGPGVCHEGYRSCFYRTLEDGELKLTEEPTYDAAEVFGR